jgi:hypothetical protein
VTSGQNTRVVDSFLPTGSVAVSAVDSVTGASIADFCIEGACSDGTGAVTVTGLVQGANELFLSTEDGSYFPRSRTGTYRLFVDPVDDWRYGRQWLGATGGTGDERVAAAVTATVGSVVTAPTARLDLTGTIGTVSDAATGAPLGYAGVNLFTAHPGSGVGESNTDEQGSYRSTGSARTPGRSPSAAPGIRPSGPATPPAATPPPRSR